MRSPTAPGYAPLGIYSEPPPPDATAIHSINIGSSATAGAAGEIVRGAQRVYDQALAFDRVARKLLDRLGV